MTPDPKEALERLTPDEQARVAWLEAELDDEPNRPVYGDGTVEPRRNGNEIAQLEAELFRLKWRAAEADRAIAIAEREGLEAKMKAAHSAWLNSSEALGREIQTLRGLYEVRSASLSKDTATLVERLDAAILGLNPLTGFGEDHIWRPADRARSALIEARAVIYAAEAQREGLEREVARLTDENEKLRGMPDDDRKSCIALMELLAVARAERDTYRKTMEAMVEAPDVVASLCARVTAAETEFAAVDHAARTLNLAVDAMWNDIARVKENRIHDRHVTAITKAQGLLHDALLHPTVPVERDLGSVGSGLTPLVPSPSAANEPATPSGLDADWFDEVDDFLDDYSDAEIIDGTTHPNKAMRLLCQLREAFGR